MNFRQSYPALWLAAAVVCVVLAGANLYWGDLNQDEGWYLYAAGLVADGKVPYRDFAFTQGPVMPYLYSLFQPFVSGHGVAGGRLISGALGILAAAGAALVARAAAPAGRRKWAAFMAFALVGINVYQSYFCAIVKTYSLCAFLLVSGMILLGQAGRRFGLLFAALAGFAFAAAAGTRLPAGAALPVVFILLLAASRVRAALCFAAGGAAGCCLVFLPFLLSDPGNFAYWLFGYHSGREAGGLLPALVYKAGFVSRLVQAYFVSIAMAAIVVCFRLFRGGDGHGPGAGGAAAPEEGFSTRLVARASWWIAGVVTVAHFCAPFPYDDYQVAVYPLFAAAVAAAAAGAAPGDRAARAVSAAVLLLCMASAFSSPVNQAWFLRERDRIWWRLKEKPSLALLREAGAEARKLAGPDGEILTQDTYLAVEAGLSVPRGMEMGPFSYYPDFSDEEADRRRVLNGRRMRESLRECGASVAAFSGYGLAIASPDVRELSGDEHEELMAIVSERYETTREIGHFGQGLTTLRIMRRREVK